ncbi:conserved hypothetical protein [Uncinocarpus reesii 1704]|uniref:Mediator of RNA polymerase II transcription subunit 18 n=1 Tax=Uncinocarpus reesii (strain UAMH 1704) TaxID=336963 RepID=C4JJW4_UNCRE|nr:uncharacterized protein UREG_01921 [Uncinocarpus reesii 1704]EEP77072.1 conserved hypothetical protein [Uncinocarpus reesii 1704]
MQPNRIHERHLIFKPYRKPGFLRPRPGGSQDVQAPEVQRLNKLLNGGLYFVKAVGTVNATDFAAPATSNDDVAMGGTASERQRQNTYDASNQSWRIEFRDIPDAGTGSAVTSRLMSTSKIPYGELTPVMDAWGYDYVSEYVLEGDIFILDGTVIQLHRVLNFPAHEQPSRTPFSHLPPLEAMVPLDPSGGYILQASITVQDSGNPDLMKAASQRLLGLKEHLKSAVKLEPADRLSLDTRVK